MRWTTPLLIVVLAGGLGLFARQTLFAPAKPPQEVYAEVERSVLEKGFDRRTALRAITRALKHPDARENEELSAKLLRLRSKIHLSMGAHDKARSDVERIQSLSADEDVELELEAIRLQSLGGQHEEALRRVEVLAFQHRESAAVAFLKGDLQKQRGRVLREEAHERAALYMVEEDARSAGAIIDLICAQHPLDPRRTQTVRKLRKYFPDARGEQLAHILDACDLASDHYIAARASFAQGLEEELSIPALGSLLNLLVESGRSDLVVDLGISSRVFPEIMNDPDNLLALVDAMKDLGQNDRIGRIVSKWPWEENITDGKFYRRAAQVLFQAERYRPLTRAARALRNFNAEELNLSDFYLGYLTARGKNLEASQRRLDQFLRSKAKGPQPDTRTITYRTLAEIWRKRGDSARELRALKGVVEEGFMVAEDYLHLAEAQQASANTLPLVCEQSWTKGMSMDPKRTPELMPIWEAMGNKTFATFGEDFDEFYNSLVKSRKSDTGRRIGPYTRWKIGAQHLQNRRYPSADIVGTNLRRRYPNLVPALDLQIDAMLAMKSRSTRAVEAVMHRFRIVGADEKSQAYLARFNFQDFSQEQTLELVRLDPYGVGRKLVAHDFFKKEEYARVVSTLRPVAENPDPPAVHATRIRSLLQSERFEEVIKESEFWLNDPEIGETCRQMALQAHLALGQKKEVAGQVRAILGSTPKDPKGRLQIAKELTAKGMHDLAGPILMHLDSSRGRRTQEVIFQLALFHALKGNLVEANNDLQRSAAFYANGQPELAQLVLAAKAREWPSLPVYLDRLRKTTFQPTPIQEASLALLEDRFQMGLALATDGLRKDPGNPRWALLLSASQGLLNQPITSIPSFGPRAQAETVTTVLGKPGAPRDPRDGIALLLAIDTPGWAAWSLAQARELQQEGGGGLWPGLIIGEALIALGELESANKHFQDLATRFPDSMPVWNGRERCLQRLYPLDPLAENRIQFHREQADQLSLRPYLAPHQLQMGLAAQSIASGDPDNAIETLKRYLETSKRKQETEIRRVLGDLLIARGDYRTGIEQLDRILHDANDRLPHPWTPLYLSWLKEAVSKSVPPAQRLSVEGVAKRLDALVRRYPKDPLVVLERIKHRVLVDQRSKLVAAEEAQSALKRLQTRVGNADLDSLRPDSHRLWTEYFLDISPIMAEDYCQGVLAADAGNLSMWVGLSQSYHAQGRLRETRELVSDLLKVADDPELHYRYAALLALEGKTSEQVRFHLQRGDALNGLVGNSARNQYWQAQMVLMEGSGGLDSVIRTLADLWNKRDRIASEIPPLEIGRTYLTALVLRHQESDILALEIATEEMLLYANQDPYSEDLIRAYRSMGKAIRGRVDDTNTANPPK